MRRARFDTGWTFALGHAADTGKDFGFKEGEAFLKAGKAEGPCSSDFDDSSWRAVDLPHDWAVELPFSTEAGHGLYKMHGYKAIGPAFPQNSIGWYRKRFTVDDSVRGNRIAVEFDGVFRDCTVWLNGHFIYRNLSGYVPFFVDISDYVEFGCENLLVVRCDASQFEGWFYEGAGIYRHAWLVTTDPVHVPQWGLRVHAKPDRGDARVETEIETVNESDQHRRIHAEITLFAPSGQPIARQISSAMELQPWSSVVAHLEFLLGNVQRWSLETPHLYRAKVRLADAERDLDEVETTFGIREIRFDKDKGFFLNGVRIPIHGACCHQDHAGVGSALPDPLQDFRIRQLKKYGFNAYRASHNAPTPELLDACDRLGMLVLDENRILGSCPEVQSQLERLIKRDRNHPCIIAWSLANEEPIANSDVGARIATSMMRTIRRLDPHRPITMASNHGNNDEGLHPLVDLRGFNYMKVSDLDAYRKLHPEQTLWGTEEASTLTTRGVYVTDEDRATLSAYDIHEPGWGATAEGWWSFFAEREWLAGGFVWTGFDYRGEPTPYRWPNISSHFGVLDTCGFPKDIAFYYQSWWTNKTVLHIFPHWNWSDRDGEIVDVWAFSNCDEVELFLNGGTLGRKPMPRNGHLEWKVPYAPGKLEAIGYCGGIEVTRKMIETTGEAENLQLSPDRTNLAADGRDCCVVTVSAHDSDGRLVPTALQRVGFQVEGPGRMIGVGNGDPSCHSPDRFLNKPWSRPLYHGLAQVIIQTLDEPGTIMLRARGQGLAEGCLEIACS